MNRNCITTESVEKSWEIVHPRWRFLSRAILNTKRVSETRKECFKNGYSRIGLLRFSVGNVPIYILFFVNRGNDLAIGSGVGISTHAEPIYIVADFRESPL